MYKPRKNKSYRRKKYVRGHKPAARNYNDPAYKEWRKDVLKRDGWRCQYLGCNCKKTLQVHHILKWGEYPALRFNIQNGITLCRKHHDMIWGKEDSFIRLFHSILSRQAKDKK